MGWTWELYGTSMIDIRSTKMNGKSRKPTRKLTSLALIDFRREVTNGFRWLT
jgi:hypothetical protein